MSDLVLVIGTFAICYAVIFGYTAYLHMRYRRVKG